MINKNQFSDAMSGLDVETVERYLRAEQACLASKAKRRRTRIFTALAAAVLALAMLASFAIIPFVPKTYDLNYEFPKHQFANTNTKVFFVTEDGEIQSQRVKLPDTESNVFLTWKHLNTVGDEVQLLGYTEHVEEDANTAVVPNNLWEFLVMKLNGSASDGYKTVTATLSPQITSYENYDALIESLIQTIAKYAGVSTEQVKILIDGEGVEIVPPDGISGRLQFSHSLMGGNAMAVVGGTLDITVTMTNISLDDIEFTGSWGEFVPSAILTMGSTAVITHEPYDVTQEYQKYTLAPGESREMTYTFPIPEGAVCGEYDLLVTFGDDSFTFEKAVQVVEITIPEDIIKTLEFYYSQPGTYATLGSTAWISVGMTNISDYDIDYIGSSSAFVPDAVLRLDNTIIEHEIYPHNEDIVEQSLKPGVSREVTYKFSIPENAMCGAYDLIVSFGKESFTFEKAVQVVGFGYVPETTGFTQFMEQYGFASYDPPTFEQAVRELTYQGTGIFDMTPPASVNWAPGYSGEMWWGDLFEYEYSIYNPDGTPLVYKNRFTAYALPDGMTLPYGITSEDTLIVALEKMGYDAQYLIDAQQNVLLFGNTECGVWLQFVEKSILITYIDTDSTVVPEQNADSQTNTYIMTLNYVADTGAFRLVEAKTEAEIKPTGGAFIGEPKFTYINGEKSDLVFTGEFATKLMEILNHGAWKQGKPKLESSFDSVCIIGNRSLAYYTSAGVFVDSSTNRHLSLSKEDTDMINAILGAYQPE